MKKSNLLFMLFLVFTLVGCGNNLDYSIPKEEDQIVSSEDIHEDLIKDMSGQVFVNSVGSESFPDEVILHYHRDDNTYADKALWLWSDTVELNQEFELVDDENNYSYSYTFNPYELFGNNTDSSFRFLYKSKNSWSWKTSDMIVEYANYPSTLVTNDEGEDIYRLELYVVATGARHDIYKSLDEALSDQVSSAFIGPDFKKINIYTADGTGNGSSIIKDLKIYKFTRSYALLSDDAKTRYRDDYLLFSANNVGKQDVAVTFSKTLTINCNYTLEITFEDKPNQPINYTISYENLYDNEKFQELNYSGNDLGVTFGSDKSTHFKVWAPTASNVTLRVYEYGYDSTYLPKDVYQDSLTITRANTYASYPMTLNLETFVWEYDTSEYLNGKYYTYYVTNSNGSSELVDPYAKSASIDGKRGMIIDFDSEEATSEDFEKVPLVWDNVDGYDISSPQELVISENHIRDLTMNETWNGTKEYAGTYKGFIESGTTYTLNDGSTPNPVTVKTGYDHMIEYGVNAIQLLPVFDQDNAERARVSTTFEGDDTTYNVIDENTLGGYNWGYNPLNYNVVEGQYSTNPRDGFVRVKEFKDLVAKFALSENHTRIIMDVVYNHVSSAPNSNFEKIMPKYYFRFNADGSYSDASGCGNEVKTEAPMMRKFIVDSVCFWASEYKIKGFRFDLMGAIDLETMNQVADKLYEIDPDIVVYGEGWYAAAPRLSGDQLAVNQNLAANLYPGRTSESDTNYVGKGFVGGFNNGGRDALKGDNGFNQGVYWGYIGKGEADLYDDIINRTELMMVGANGYSGCSWNPMQNVNYVSCHDNFTLFDQLNYILSDTKTPENIEVIAKASASVNGMVLMSNSMAFINGGEELFRTKIEDASEVQDGEVTMFAGTDYEVRISHNSYRSSDFTNSYDYARKAELYEYFLMYKELVEIKKNLDYSSDIVTGEMHSYKSGDAASIDTTNTKGTLMGVNRLAKDGSTYGIYLVARTSASRIYSSGNVVFNNSNLDITPNVNGFDVNDNPYSLIIIKK